MIKSLKRLLIYFFIFILSISVSFCMFVFIKSNLTSPKQQEKEHIKLKCIKEKEVQTTNENGEKEIKRIEATTVIPGDIVIYTISYTVIGEKIVDDVVIDNPIPQDMIYQDGSAYGYNTDIEFSIDGGNTFASPENLNIMDSKGNEHLAMASDYTNIRWILKNPVAHGKTGRIVYKAMHK